MTSLAVLLVVVVSVSDIAAVPTTANAVIGFHWKTGEWGECQIAKGACNTYTSIPVYGHKKRSVWLELAVKDSWSNILDWKSLKKFQGSLKFLEVSAVSRKLYLITFHLAKKIRIPKNLVNFQLNSISHYFSPTNFFKHSA